MPYTARMVTKHCIVFALLVVVVHAANPYHSPHVEDNHLFDMTIVDSAASGSYSLLLHDVNGDGRKDLVSLAYSGTTSKGKDNPGEIYWYQSQKNKHWEAPMWKKRLIVSEPHVVHGDWMDVDGDGHLDLVYNSHFEPVPGDDKGQGVLSWVKHPGSFSSDKTDEPWERQEIGSIVGNHRVVTGDFDGDGRVREVLAVPLFAVGEGPFYGSSTIRMFYLDGEGVNWKFFDIKDYSQKNTHDANPVPRADGRAGVSAMVCSHSGISRIDFSRVDGEWKYEIIVLAESTGDDSKVMKNYRDIGFEPLHNKQNTEKDMRGVTSISSVDMNDANKTPYIATIEYSSSSSFLDGQPWHGDIVALYTPQAGKSVLDGGLQRQVLERRFSGGHTAEVLDFNGDGCYDVAAGFREYPTAFVLYHCHEDKETKRKSFYKQILSERGINKIIPYDFNNDGKADMATVGFGEAGDPYLQVWYNIGSSSEVAAFYNIRPDPNGDSEEPSIYMKALPYAVLGLMIAFIVVGIAVYGIVALFRRSSRKNNSDNELFDNLLERDA